MYVEIRTAGSPLCNRADDLKTGADTVPNEVNCSFSRGRTAYISSSTRAPVLGQPQLGWLPLP